MKHTFKFSILFILFIAIRVCAQENLPDFGNIADLKGMNKAYVSADSTEARKFILEEIRKYKILEVVSSADDAQFVLECKQIGRVKTGSSLITELPTFEMVAYTQKGGRRRIAWSETKTSLRYPPMLLTRDFVGALKKAAK